MRFILSFAIVLVYWCLEAYQAMLNFDITYNQALLLDYTQSNMYIKIIIALTIFIFSIAHAKTKTEIIKIENKHCTNEKLNALYGISEIILSPMPIQKQLNSIVDILEKKLTIKSAFIGAFESDKIVLLNTNESLNKINIKKQYLPHHNDLEPNTLDKLLSISFLEKRDYIDKIIEISGVKYRAIIQSYKDSHSKKPLGVTVLLLDKEEKSEYKNFLERVSEQIAFTVNLAKKKDDAIQAHNNYNAQFLSIDTELNISSNSKLQEMIGHEIKRSQRYRTSLSLIIIKIDHFENLSNIFTDKETLALKKELATLFKKNIRETEMFGKWSDNSFAIVSPDIDFRVAKSLANKLNRKLSEHRFAKVGKITCSYGITSFSVKDTIGDFRKRAENALKVAIERGGNSVEVKILV